MSSITLDIKRTVADTVRLPFEAMAAAALPKGYQLSLVICGDRLAQRMNKEYRKKTYRPNVLSFPIAKNEGEIFLNIRKAEREAKQEGISRDARLALLFVHGCFHLAGYNHGDKMESLELKILKKFGFA
jgi:rRNA maturation RNase YbeY